MIRILYSNGRYYPLMYCDCCEERITEPGMAMVMFDADPAEGVWSKNPICLKSKDDGGRGSGGPDRA